MKPLDMDTVQEFVSQNIVTFHESKLRLLSELKLEKLLKAKNPYLFRAKNLNVAADFVREILDARLSSSEEKLFGDFLEELAIFIAGLTTDGRKSAATGIDLEFTENNILHLVSIKSGPNWGNSSQQKQQERNFKTAVGVVKQTNHKQHVEPVLGICYGKTVTKHLRGYTKIVGQNFWYFISGNPNLYTQIVEPIGYQAREHNEAFHHQRGAIVNQFTTVFTEKFCTDGFVNWDKLVAFNSGNLDLT